MSEFKVPSEVIDLPSKGLFYPKQSPLSKGQVELHYMTARHEDILTSRNLIQKGVVFDKLLEELIVDKSIKYEDLLVGDRNGLLIAARIMAYGKEYPLKSVCPVCLNDTEFSIDLENIQYHEIDYGSIDPKNLTFTMPSSGITVTFRLVTMGIENQIQQELAGLAKISKSDINPELTTRLRYVITSVNGETGLGQIKQFVDNLPSRDSLAFRRYLKSITPNVNMTQNVVCSKCTAETKVEVPLTGNFFWPDSGV